MSNTFFNIFPNENFIDLCMYQFGYEQCDPGHSFGLQHATTTCFTTFFPEPEHSWQTIPKEKHGPIL